MCLKIIRDLPQNQHTSTTQPAHNIRTHIMQIKTRQHNPTIQHGQGECIDIRSKGQIEMHPVQMARILINYLVHRVPSKTVNRRIIIDDRMRLNNHTSDYQVLSVQVLQVPIASVLQETAISPPLSIGNHPQQT